MSKKLKTLVPADAVLAEVTIAGHTVTAICRMGKTLGRALKLEPLYVRAEDFERLARIDEVARIAVDPNVRLPAVARTDMPTMPPPPAVDGAAVCLNCGIHKAALDELGGCPRAVAGVHPTDCLLAQEARLAS